MGDQSKVNFAIFVSGYGNGAIEIIENNNDGLIQPKPALLLSSNPQSFSLQVARDHNIPTAVVERDRFKDKKSYERAIMEQLDRYDIDYIFLAGYRLIVGKELLSSYKDRIVNIHPSLLPAFKGMDAIGQALDAGVKITGVTTHVIDGEIDEGAIVDQKAVRIRENDDHDSLSNKVFKMGSILTVKTINSFFKYKLHRVKHD